MPISRGDGKVFVCVEYFAHKARLPGWCVDTNLTPQFSSTKEPVLQKNGEYIRLKNISRQQKQIFSEYLSVCAISGGIRGNGLNLVGRIFSTSYKKKEEGVFLPTIHNLRLKENESKNISDFWKASDNFSKVLWLLILPQYCATKALPRMGQFRCHEVYCLIFPEGTKQHSDIFLFSFCSKDNVIFFG